MSLIPDFMPMLRSGSGVSPEDGGCLVQCASYLADGHSWNETTDCVHPLLRALAVQVNDHTCDAARPLLGPLAADLVGTGPAPAGVKGTRLSARLGVWIARQFDVDPWSRVALNTVEVWALKDLGAKGRTGWRTSCGRNAINLLAVEDRTPVQMLAAHVAMAPEPWYSDFAVARYAVDIIAEYYDQDSELRRLLAGAIAEHRRLTGHTPPPVDPERAAQILATLGSAK